MEGGSDIFRYITYGIAAFVILAMIALLVRTFTLAIGFLSLNFADALQRWRPAREWFERRQAREQEREARAREAR